MVILKIIGNNVVKKMAAMAVWQGGFVAKRHFEAIMW